MKAQRYVVALNFIILQTLFGLDFVQSVKTRLTWINGIGYTKEHMVEGGKEISQYFGGKPVLFCHNPTGMAHEADILGYVSDLTQAGTQKLGRVTAEVNILVQHLRDALLQVGKRGRVIHICHSQGVLITYLATKQLSAGDMERIEILAFGGAAALQKNARTPFHRCVNYYSVNDPLLLLIPEAAQALKKTGTWIGDDQFCFLAPRVGDPVKDHALLAPTYARALQWEGKRFQQTYQSIAYRTIRSLGLLFLSLFRWLSTRLDALVSPLVQAVVLRGISFMRILVLCSDKLVRPIAILVVLLAEWIRETLCNLTGRQKYAPVTSDVLAM